VYEREVVRADHRLHERNGGNAGKSGEGALEERIPTESAKLLGKIATRPYAPSRGYYDGCDTRHVLLLDVALL
jgi:hypothetical protein